MNNESIQVRIYADSLALPRLNFVEKNARYLSLLKKKWLTLYQDIEIIERAKGGSTITDLYEVYCHDNSYFGQTADVMILHVGICDCSPRPIPGILRKIIARLPSFLKKMVIYFLHKNRAVLLKLGLSWKHTPPKLFRKILSKWISEAALNYKKIYVITIAPTNDYFEKHSPGWTKSINAYNDLIKNVIEGSNTKNINLIDIHKIIINDIKNIDSYILKEDGHHLTTTAHEIIAAKLIEMEGSQQ